MNKLKELWSTWCTSGLKLPYAFNPESEKPSITLMMLYFSTLIMFSAEITNLFLNSILVPTLVTVFVWFIAFVMYRLRRIDSFKFDLDDQSIEVKSSEETEQEEK